MGAAHLVGRARVVGHGWHFREPQILQQRLKEVVQERDELLSALSGFSPDLLNTPKWNAAGESTLTVKQHIAIAWAEIRGWLDELEEGQNKLAALEQQLKE